MDGLKLAVFLRISAVFVGLANAAVLYGFGDESPARKGEVAWSVVLLYALAAVVAGLLAAEFLLRPMRRLLEGGFFLRYAAAVLGVCLGGALTSALLTFGTLLSIGSLGEAWTLVFVSASLGGTLGLIEGLVLALPLAAILGRFRGRS